MTDHATPYHVTPWANSSDQCDYCDDGDDYSEHRHAFYVSRDGASARTADDLANVFMFDVCDLAESEPFVTDTDASRAMRAELRETAEYWAGRLDAVRDPISGWAWLSDDDENTDDINDWIAEYESVLADCGLTVSWDDGYTIAEIESIDAWLAYASRDGGMVPCSRYGRNSATCAPYAAACHAIYVDANGDTDDWRASIDYYMGLAVNDHNDVAELIREHRHAVPAGIGYLLDDDTIALADWRIENMATDVVHALIADAPAAYRRAIADRVAADDIRLTDDEHQRLLDAIADALDADAVTRILTDTDTDGRTNQ